MRESEILLLKAAAAAAYDMDGWVEVGTRRHAFTGRWLSNYPFGGLRVPGSLWPQDIERLGEFASRAATEQLGRTISFTHCSVAAYSRPNGRIPPHKDDEPEHADDIICSISEGGRCCFRWWPEKGPRERSSAGQVAWLSHGDIVLFNRLHRHEAERISSPRLNFTYRVWRPQAGVGTLGSPESLLPEAPLTPGLLPGSSLSSSEEEGDLVEDLFNTEPPAAAEVPDPTEQAASRLIDGGGSSEVAHGDARERARQLIDLTGASSAASMPISAPTGCLEGTLKRPRRASEGRERDPPQAPAVLPRHETGIHGTDFLCWDIQRLRDGVGLERRTFSEGECMGPGAKAERTDEHAQLKAVTEMVTQVQDLRAELMLESAAYKEPQLTGPDALADRRTELTQLRVMVPLVEEIHALRLRLREAERDFKEAELCGPAAVADRRAERDVLLDRLERRGQRQCKRLRAGIAKLRTQMGIPTRPSPGEGLCGPQVVVDLTEERQMLQGRLEKKRECEPLRVQIEELHKQMGMSPRIFTEKELYRPQVMAILTTERDVLLARVEMKRQCEPLCAQIRELRAQMEMSLRAFSEEEVTGVAAETDRTQERAALKEMVSVQADIQRMRHELGMLRRVFSDAELYGSRALPDRVEERKVLVQRSQVETGITSLATPGGHAQRCCRWPPLVAYGWEGALMRFLTRDAWMSLLLTSKAHRCSLSRWASRVILTNYYSHAPQPLGPVVTPCLAVASPESRRLCFESPPAATAFAWRHGLLELTTLLQGLGLSRLTSHLAQLGTLRIAVTCLVRVAISGSWLCEDMPRALFLQQRPSPPLVYDSRPYSASSPESIIMDYLLAELCPVRAVPLPPRTDRHPRPGGPKDGGGPGGGEDRTTALPTPGMPLDDTGPGQSTPGRASGATPGSEGAMNESRWDDSDGGEEFMGLSELWAGLSDDEESEGSDPRVPALPPASLRSSGPTTPPFESAAQRLGAAMAASKMSYAKEQAMRSSDVLYWDERHARAVVQGLDGVAPCNSPDGDCCVRGLGRLANHWLSQDTLASLFGGAIVDLRAVRRLVVSHAASLDSESLSSVTGGDLTDSSRAAWGETAKAPREHVGVEFVLLFAHMTSVSAVEIFQVSGVERFQWCPTTHAWTRVLVPYLSYSKGDPVSETCYHLAFVGGNHYFDFGFTTDYGGGVSCHCGEGRTCGAPQLNSNLSSGGAFDGGGTSGGPSDNSTAAGATAPTTQTVPAGPTRGPVPDSHGGTEPRDREDRPVGTPTASAARASVPPGPASRLRPRPDGSGTSATPAEERPWGVGLPPAVLKGVWSTARQQFVFAGVRIVCDMLGVFHLQATEDFTDRVLILPLACIPLDKKALQDCFEPGAESTTHLFPYTKPPPTLRLPSRPRTVQACAVDQGPPSDPFCSGLGAALAMNEGSLREPVAVFWGNAVVQVGPIRAGQLVTGSYGWGDEVRRNRGYSRTPLTERELWFSALTAAAKTKLQNKINTVIEESHYQREKICAHLDKQGHHDKRWLTSVQSLYPSLPPPQPQTYPAWQELVRGRASMPAYRCSVRFPDAPFIHMATGKNAPDWEAGCLANGTPWLLQPKLRRCIWGASNAVEVEQLAVGGNVQQVFIAPPDTACLSLALRPFWTLAFFENFICKLDHDSGALRQRAQLLALEWQWTMELPDSPDFQVRVEGRSMYFLHPATLGQWETRLAAAHAAATMAEESGGNLVFISPPEYVDSHVVRRLAVPLLQRVQRELGSYNLAQLTHLGLLLAHHPHALPSLDGIDLQADYFFTRGAGLDMDDSRMKLVSVALQGGIPAYTIRPPPLLVPRTVVSELEEGSLEPLLFRRVTPSAPMQLSSELVLVQGAEAECWSSQLHLETVADWLGRPAAAPLSLGSLPKGRKKIKLTVGMTKAIQDHPRHPQLRALARLQPATVKKLRAAGCPEELGLATCPLTSALTSGDTRDPVVIDDLTVLERLRATPAGAASGQLPGGWSTPDGLATARPGAGEAPATPREPVLGHDFSSAAFMASEDPQPPPIPRGPAGGFVQGSRQGLEGQLRPPTPGCQTGLPPGDFEFSIGRHCFRVMFRDTPCVSLRRGTTVRRLREHKEGPLHILHPEAVECAGGPGGVLSRLEGLKGITELQVPSLSPSMVRAVAMQVVTRAHCPSEETVQTLLGSASPFSENGLYPGECSIADIQRRNGVLEYVIHYPPTLVLNSTLAAVGPSVEDHIQLRSPAPQDTAKSIVTWRHSRASSFELPAGDRAACLLRFNGHPLEYHEGVDIKLALERHPRRLFRGGVKALPSIRGQGERRIVLVRWERDPDMWHLEHGAAVDAFKELSTLQKAEMHQLRQWRTGAQFDPGVPPQSIPSRGLPPPAGLPPCIATEAWSWVALLAGFMLSLGTNPECARPTQASSWRVFLESSLEACIRVLTDASHLGTARPSKAVAQTLLLQALTQCGWECVVARCEGPSTVPLDLSQIEAGASELGEPSSLVVQTDVLLPVLLLEQVWSTRPGSRRLLAILQGEPGAEAAWGWVRTADRIFQLRPSRDPPLLPVFQRAQPLTMKGSATLIWSAAEVGSADPCPCRDNDAEEAGEVTYCSLCPRGCEFGGHRRALKGLTLCSPCLLSLGGPVNDPTCGLCHLPLADASSIGCATCGLRAHTLCSPSLFEVRLADFKAFCHRYACRPLGCPAGSLSPTCMGCSTHLTISPGSIPCEGSCGRSWCLPCRSRHTLCRRCRPVAAPASSSKSGFEKQTNARSGAPS